MLWGVGKLCGEPCKTPFLLDGLSEVHGSMLGFSIIGMIAYTCDGVKIRCFPPPEDWSRSRYLHCADYLGELVDYAQRYSCRALSNLVVVNQTSSSCEMGEGSLFCKGEWVSRVFIPYPIITNERYSKTIFVKLPYGMIEALRP